jgi:hypothetical protein
MAVLAAVATAAQGACGSPDDAGAGGGTGGDPVATACAALCSTSAADGCLDNEPVCRVDCEARFGAPGCDGAAIALLDCYAAAGPTGCELPAGCSAPAAQYAACRGALGGTDKLTCEPLSPGCACVTDCAGFAITTECDPQDGHCVCIIDGPIGPSGDAALATECVSSAPTNKWCQGQPFGCCEELF